MRLWLALPCAVIIPGGIPIFGLGLANVSIPVECSQPAMCSGGERNRRLKLTLHLFFAGIHWIVLAVGYAVFGFGFFAVGDIALSYTTDCYQDVRGPPADL